MPLLGPPRQSFGIVVAIVVAFLVTLFSLLGWTAEWLWMHELGYATVFWRLRGLQIAMFLGMLLIAGLYFALDLRFLGRIAQRIEAGGHAVPTDPSIWAMLRTGGLLVPIIAAILAATFSRPRGTICCAPSSPAISGGSIRSSGAISDSTCSCCRSSSEPRTWRR